MDLPMVAEKAPSEAEIAITKFDTTNLVVPANPMFQFLEERHIFEDHPVFLQILCMTNSYFVWVGSIPPVMQSVQLLVPAKAEAEAASTTILASKNSDMDGLTIAAKLSKKFNASVLISFNLSDSIPGIKEFAEVKIFEMLKRKVSPTDSK